MRELGAKSPTATRPGTNEPNAGSPNTKRIKSQEQKIQELRARTSESEELKSKEFESENLKSEEQNEELAITNKRVTLALTLLCSLISLAYLLEIVKGARTVEYTLLVIALAMVPVLLAQIFLRRKADSRAIKYITAIGYAIMYTFVLLTSENPLVFTYLVPMLIVLTLYDDVSYILKIGVSGLIVNMIAIVIGLRNATTTTAAAEIQGLVMLMIMAFLIMVGITNHKFALMRAARLKAESDKTEALLCEVLKIAGGVTEIAVSLSDEMSILKDSIDHTLDSMEEVSQGTGESAETVDISRNNQESVSHINMFVGELNVEAEKLKAHQ